MSFGDENRVNRPHIREVSLRRCVVKRGGLQKEEGKQATPDQKTVVRRSSGSVNFSGLKVDPLGWIVNPLSWLGRESLGCQAAIPIPPGLGPSAHRPSLQPLIRLDREERDGGQGRSCDRLNFWGWKWEWVGVRGGRGRVGEFVPS